MRACAWSAYAATDYANETTTTVTATALCPCFDLRDRKILGIPGPTGPVQRAERSAQCLTICFKQSQIRTPLAALHASRKSQGNATFRGRDAAKADSLTGNSESDEAKRCNEKFT